MEIKFIREYFDIFLFRKAKPVKNPWSYLWIIFTPKLFVWLAKLWTTETRRVTDLLRRMMTNFDALLKRNGSAFRSTIFDVRDFVAFDVVNVFDDDLRLSDATSTFVDESTSGNVATNDFLSSDNVCNIWRNISPPTFVETFLEKLDHFLLNDL